MSLCQRVRRPPLFISLKSCNVVHFVAVCRTTLQYVSKSRRVSRFERVFRFGGFRGCSFFSGNFHSRETLILQYLAVQIQIEFWFNVILCRGIRISRFGRFWGHSIFSTFCRKTQACSPQPVPKKMRLEIVIGMEIWILNDPSRSLSICLKTLQHTATCCNTLYLKTLQHTAAIGR